MSKIASAVRGLLNLGSSTSASVGAWATVAYFTGIEMAEAQWGGGGRTLGGMASSVDNDIGTSIPALLATGAYIAGGAFAIGGIMRLIKHGEAPQQVPMKEGIVRLGGGVALIVITFIIESVANTLGASGAGRVNRPTL